MGAQAQSRLRRKGDRLAVEIAFLLVIKGALLFAIWAIWFSNPEARHMRLPGDRVTVRLIAAEPAPDGATPAAVQPRSLPASTQAHR